MKKLPQVSPLTLKRLREPFDHHDWIFEIKHDGFRGVAYISDSRCHLVSRNGHIFKSFKPLCKVLGNLRVKDAILDGEIVCLDGDGVSIFNQLLFRRGVQHFYAFDLMWLNGHDLRSLALVERKKWLKKLIARANNPALLYADHVERHGVDLFRMTCEKNLEGIVAKHRTSSYDETATWLKIKNAYYTQRKNRHELFEKRSTRNGNQKLK